MWNPDQPYNRLPDPPASALESVAVLKATVEARAAIASLDQAVRRIPNPAVLVSAIPLLGRVSYMRSQVRIAAIMAPAR